MTMVPQYKKCPICRKYYSWNPDVGDMSCPYCGKEVRKKIWENMIRQMSNIKKEHGGTRYGKDY